MFCSSYFLNLDTHLPCTQRTVIMKFIFFITATLLPMGLLAAPVTEDGVADIEAREPVSLPTDDQTLDLSKRAGPQRCYIVGGASKVNCRLGPSTDYKVHTQFAKGDWRNFGCVKKGECVVINGATNWSVVLL